MRHAKHTFKVGRNGSHRRAMIANQLKSLIEHGRIETTIAKAKELRRHADKMITLSKKGTLASERDIIARLRIRYNQLTPKEARLSKKEGVKNHHNADRQIISKLKELTGRFTTRDGGYTRIIKKDRQVGDAAPKCFLEFLQ